MLVTTNFKNIRKGWNKLMFQPRNLNSYMMINFIFYGLRMCDLSLFSYCLYGQKVYPSFLFCYCNHLWHDGFCYQIYCHVCCCYYFCVDLLIVYLIVLMVFQMSIVLLLHHLLQQVLVIMMQLILRHCILQVTQ